MSSKIVVIDDDMHMASIVKMLLQKHGYHVMVAEGGKEGLRLVNVWQPDLILLDLMMPQVDGYAVATQLQSNFLTAKIPILMLTSRSEMQSKLRGFESGIIDYITKPFSNQELLARINAHLKLARHYKGETRYLPTPLISLPLVLRKQRSGVFRLSYQVTKRLFDIMLSILMLPAALIVMAGVAIAIRLDSPGPILFVQKRTGGNGQRFKMLKFRTMFENAEELKEKYKHLNELTWPDFKITDDPRVTRVGRFLRKSSLDELPQLINILIGDMSFVGPRPTSFEASTYKLWQTERLEVKPGLTGLWQIAGRADIDFHERVELDIEYIERQCWALDIQILINTFGAVISSRGAH